MGYNNNALTPVYLTAYEILNGPFLSVEIMSGKHIGWLMTFIGGSSLAYGSEVIPSVIPSLRETCWDMRSDLPDGIDLTIIVDGLEYNKAFAGEISEGLSKVTTELYHIYANKATMTGDELKVSLMFAQDKSIACSEFDASCNCGNITLNKVDYDGLGCTGEGDKPHCKILKDGIVGFNYLNSLDRPDIFDPIIDYTQTTLSESSDNRKRIVVVVSPQCSRHSGQLLPDDTRLQWQFRFRHIRRYWKYIPEDVQYSWRKISRGYDAASQAVLVDDCNTRDYPSILEVGANLKLADASLIVVSRKDPLRRGYHTCINSDWLELIRDEFWIEYVGDEMEKHNVPFGFGIYLDGVQLGDQILELIKTKTDLCQ